MGRTVAQKILAEHLVEGEMKQGEEIAIRIDQTLTQDATGTMAYLEFEAIGIPRVKTELSVSYVDHNLVQSDFKNADDHRFLQSIARKFGLYFSPPGNGICHQIHRIGSAQVKRIPTDHIADTVVSIVPYAIQKHRLRGRISRRNAVQIRAIRDRIRQQRRDVDVERQT